MTLSRTALRLATMEAIAPSAIVVADGDVWPTLATKYVFDTRLDPIDDLGPDEKRPVAVVYTDDDVGEPGQKAGGPPFKRDVDLSIEISVAAMVTEDGNNFGAGTPVTDPELEGALDVFEAQILFALMQGPTGLLWRQLTARRVLSIHSTPKRTAEESTRIAARTIRMKVTIPDDVYVSAPASALTGNDRLPEPLKTIAGAMAAGSYGAKVCAGLAASAPGHPIRTPLDLVTFDHQVGAPPAPKDTNKTQINSTAPINQG